MRALRSPSSGCWARRSSATIAPTLLGSGEHLFSGLDLTALGYECTSHVPTAGATHVVLTKKTGS